MEATKFMVKFEVEVLSLDAVAGRMVNALELFKNEDRNGKLTAEDGDTVSWTTTQKQISI